MSEARAVRVYSEPEIIAHLHSHLPHWRFEAGSIRRRYRTHGWKGTLMAINAVGHLAEIAWHHPDIAASYNWLEVRLMTHDAKGITDKDFALAAKIEEFVQWNPAREGGALQGLSRALGEEVTWDDHAVTSVDWRTYHSLPLGIEFPAIESVLIDTHIFLWLESGSSRLAGNIRERIVHSDQRVFISAASFWEMAIKRRAGKLIFTGSPRAAAKAAGFVELPIDAADAELAGSLDWDRRHQTCPRHILNGAASYELR